MGPRFWRSVRTMLFSLSLLLFVLVVAVLITVLIFSLGYGHRRAVTRFGAPDKMEENATWRALFHCDRRLGLLNLGK